MINLDCMLDQGDNQAFDLLESLENTSDLFSLLDEQNAAHSIKPESMFNSDTFDINELLSDKCHSTPSAIPVKDEMITAHHHNKPVVTQTQVPAAFTIDPSVFLQDFVSPAAFMQATKSGHMTMPTLPCMPFFTPIQPPHLSIPPSPFFPGLLHPLSPPNTNTQHNKASPPNSSSGSDNDSTSNNSNNRKSAGTLKRTHDEVSSPSSVKDEFSPSPTDDGEGNDTKRQKRLIKNRESAQASRERKKNYLQNLEKKVELQEKTLSAVQNKMLSLEEENKLLRERLLQMQGGSSRELEALSKEAKTKAHRASSATLKVPIPAANSSAWLSNRMWTNFMQMPQLGPKGGLSNAARASVVLVLLFSFAIMFSLNGTSSDLLNEIAMNGSPVDSLVPDSPVAAFSDAIPDFDNNLSRRGRVLLSHDEPSVMLNADESVKDQFKNFYNKLNQLIKSESDESVTQQNILAASNNASVVLENTDEQPVYGSVKISLDETKSNLIVVLQPLDSEANSNNNSKASAKIKLEAPSSPQQHQQQLPKLNDATSFLRQLIEGIEFKL